MNKIQYPVIDEWVLFEECLNSFQDNSLPYKKELIKCEKEIRLNHKTYNKLADEMNLQIFKQHEVLTTYQNTKNTFLKLYKDGLAKEGKKVRRYYNLIKLGNQNSQNYCSYCGVNAVTEVDHFLPQDKFYMLSVEPLNLLPICSNCNKHKLSYAPIHSKSKSVLIHPYFDDVNNDSWLKAKISTIKGELCCEFFISNSFNDKDLLERIKLTIDKLYIIKFSYDIFKIPKLRKLREDFNEYNNIEDLKLYLNSELRKYKRIHYLNHPEIVIYQAALDYVSQFSFISDLLADD